VGSEMCIRERGYLVVNPDFATGLAGSIAAGVAAVATVASGVLLLMADQPLIAPEQLRGMVEAWSRNPHGIVASEYAGIEGPPVIFPADLFPELLALRGDSGARSVLRAHPGSITRFSCPAAASDIDTPADLAAIDR